MKKTIYILLFTAWGTAAQTTVSPDTLQTELSEVVVEATPFVRKADKTVYHIDDALKERSAETLGLLNNLNIANLSVNTVMEKITSSLGTVQLRVNGRDVDVQKLKAINPKNIVKVEWLDNPGLRYGTDVGAVINIIVHNPTVGGSFRANAIEALTSVFNNYFTGLTLNHGASQWEIMAGGSTRHHLDVYREYSDRYKLPDGTVVERSQTPLNGYFNQYNVWPSVAYNYMKADTTNFYVGLYFTGNWKNKSMVDGLLESNADGRIQHSQLTEINETPRYLSPSLNIYFDHKFRKDNTLILNANYSYTDTENGHRYIERNLDDNGPGTDISNFIRSHTHALYLQAHYIKNWGKGGQLTAGVNHTLEKSHSVFLDIDNAALERTFNKSYLFAEYMVPIKKFTFTAGLGAVLSSNATNSGTRESTLFFTPRASVAWRATDKSRWKLTYYNRVFSPSATQLSPIDQAIDGIQIERGNPELKPYLQHRARLQYSFSNNRNLDLGAAVFITDADKPIANYYSWEGRNILRSYSNDGHYNFTGFDLSASWQPLRDWLSLSADITFTHYDSRGKGFRHTLNSFEENFQLEVFHWNFTLSFEFNNPAPTLFGETIERGERMSLVALSYHWKNWQFSCAVFMPFGSYSQSTKVISDLVSQETEIRSHKIQRMPSLRISYNLNWGHQKSANRKLEARTEGASGATAAGR